METRHKTNGITRQIVKELTFFTWSQQKPLLESEELNEVRTGTKEKTTNTNSWHESLERTSSCVPQERFDQHLGSAVNQRCKVRIEVILNLETSVVDTNASMKDIVAVHGRQHNATRSTAISEEESTVRLALEHL